MCCQNKLLCVTVILIVSLLLIFSQYEHLHKMKKAVNIFSDPIETHNNKTEHKVTVSNVRRRSSIQSRRLNLVKNVCDGYRRDPDFNRLYVQNPGKKNRGKFTLEPKSKLFMCNVMKQGKIESKQLFTRRLFTKRKHSQLLSILSLLHRTNRTQYTSSCFKLTNFRYHDLG